MRDILYSRQTNCQGKLPQTADIRHARGWNNPDCVDILCFLLYVLLIYNTVQMSIWPQKAFFEEVYACQ